MMKPKQTQGNPWADPDLMDEEDRKEYYKRRQKVIKDETDKRYGE
jgi:hypothetical protein